MRKALGMKRPGLALKKPKAPGKVVEILDSAAVAELIAATADILLSVDKDGIIRDVAFGRNDLAASVAGEWLGKLWADTVTVESRTWVEALLQDAGSKVERWQQIDHSGRRGAGVPILYGAIRVGSDGGIVALGRDLRAIEGLQHRLMHVEHSTEKELARLRHAETRYRLLLQMVSEGVLIVAARTGKVIEANPAAAEIFGENLRRLIGRRFPQGFDEQGGREVEGLLAAVRTNGRGESVRARLAASGCELTVAASLFRQHDASHILVLVRPSGSEAACRTRSTDAAAVATPRGARSLPGRMGGDGSARQHSQRQPGVS